MLEANYNQTSHGNTRLVVALWAAMASAMTQIFAFTPLATQISADLSLSYTQLGLLQTGIFVPYAILQIIAGTVTDRYQSVKLVTLSTASFIVSTVFFAISQSYLQALVFRVLMGISMSFVFVPSVKLILAATNKQRRGRVLGFYGSSLAAGSVIAAALPVPIASLLGGWRVSLLAIDMMGVIALILLLSSYKRKIQVTVAPLAASAFSSLLRKKETWVLGYGQMMRFGVGTAVSTWVPTFMVVSHGFSLFNAGIILAVAWSVSAFTIFLGGVLSDMFRKFFMIEAALLGMAPAFLVLAMTSNIGLLWVSTLVIGALMYFDFAALFVILPELYSEERIGLITGLENTLAAVASFIFPPVLGFLSDRTATFAYGWVLMSMLCVIGAFATLYVKRY